MKETLDCLRAARAVGITDRETLKLALRAVLCSSKSDWGIFNGLFDAFWSAHGQQRAEAHPERKKPKQPTDDWGRPQSATIELLGGSSQVRDTDDTGTAVSGATAIERLRKVDFSQIPHSDLPALERISQRLLRQMSLRLSRRLKTPRPRGPIDLRRTIRRSISRGGEPVSLIRKGRRLQPARLVILLDVSGSMNAYSLFLVRFAYALEKHFKRVNTFVFSAQLREITAALRTRELPEALQALSQEPAGWSGGTRIGESLRDFNYRYSGRLLSRDTLVIILSDGWDTGEPEIVAQELSTIRRRSRQVIWLNPLLGMEGYQPLTRGMAAALPYIDVFAAAHNLESLLELEHHLGRGRTNKYARMRDTVSAHA
ncbi:MAG TPA: VWA domain-containing protein [Candidatus Angelobacter sp.]